jgi:hypothetical protein
MEGREAHGGELSACSFGRHRCCLAPCPGPPRVSEASRERIQSAEAQVNVMLVVAGLEVREFLLVSFEVDSDFNNFRASQFGDLRFSRLKPNAIRQQRKVNKDYNPSRTSSFILTILTTGLILSSGIE